MNQLEFTVLLLVSCWTFLLMCPYWLKIRLLELFKLTLGSNLHVQNTYVGTTFGWPCCNCFLFEFYFYAHFHSPGSRTARQTAQTEDATCLISFSSQKTKKGLKFFPLWGMWAPEECVRKCHWEKITNIAGVSCVCGQSGMGSRWTSKDWLLKQGPQFWLVYSSSQSITHFYTPSSLAFHNKPPYSYMSESKQIKVATEVFTLPKFTWGSCTQIRSFSNPDPNIEGNLF